MYIYILNIDNITEHYIFIVRLCICHCHILKATWLDLTDMGMECSSFLALKLLSKVSYLTLLSRNHLCLQ